MNPLRGCSFDEIIGRSPNLGDSVRTLSSSGLPLISYFGPVGWYVKPVVEVTESAIFDLSGNAFSGFILPTGVTVPEPGTPLLAFSATLLFFGKRRRRTSNRSLLPGTDHAF